MLTFRILSPVCRLHIQLRKRPRPSGGSPSPVRPKRHVEQHMVNAANISSTATGSVQIINVDPKGKYVQIKNMAEQVGFSKHIVTILGPWGTNSPGGIFTAWHYNTETIYKFVCVTPTVAEEDLIYPVVFCPSLSQPESVGGFKLTHMVMETGQEDTFVFHARSRLKGGSTTTVSSM